MLSYISRYAESRVCNLKSFRHNAPLLIFAPDIKK